ncbi:ABC transporter ATP-binding protein [Thiocapsa bogorovii]|uniref:ABC transporter ATP-binding protein n=1 Tax=Thiocapsa bogorovii TaxID=521689 RepID=UPI001E29AB41|nr:ATP-binding cassette domain-containing protein [Thiocapsa bogorovii]UHD17144.1 ATP-binding cassette domain-containing protein [Thiocapsa bogorovii]
MGIPALAAFLALLYRMQRPVRDVLSSRVAFDAGFPAVEDVADYLERTAEPFLVDGDRRFIHLQHGVEFRDVTFRYPGSDSPALDRVSLRIPKGETTAIVGRSGSGKSTLMDLLFRFRDPTEGEILVDGVPLSRLEIRSWRERLSIMSQAVYLLNDSVAANIGYGKANGAREEIRRAAEIAGAAGFIEALPIGYETLLGDEGFRLSGGQRQRIALARTILRNPDILLLDEATNALDAESERLFQSALRTYCEGRTLVVIAHRPSPIA